MSKVTLTSGVANVYVKHGTTILKSGQERKITTVKVVLADGTELTGDAVCHGKDNFCKRLGRKLAFIRLCNGDNEAATEKAISTVSRPKKAVESGSLSKAATAHYKLPRLDRTTVFQKVCPEYFRNTPERKKAREVAILNRLVAKYGTNAITPPKGAFRCGNELPTAKPKTVSIKQTIGDVKAGATVVGAVIGNVG